MSDALGGGFRLPKAMREDWANGKDQHISPPELEGWEYCRPRMAGFYWWQEDERSAPVIVEFRAEGNPGDFVHRWSARVLDGGRAVPCAYGRWRWIDHPSAFAKWEQRP